MCGDLLGKFLLENTKYIAVLLSVGVKLTHFTELGMKKVAGHSQGHTLKLGKSPEHSADFPPSGLSDRELSVPLWVFKVLHSTVSFTFCTKFSLTLLGDFYTVLSKF